MAKSIGPYEWIPNPYAGTRSPYRNALPGLQDAQPKAQSYISEDDAYLAHLAGLPPQEYVSRRDERAADEIFENKRMEAAGTLTPIARGMPSAYTPPQGINLGGASPAELQRMADEVKRGTRSAADYATFIKTQPGYTDPTLEFRKAESARGIREKVAAKVAAIDVKSQRFNQYGKQLWTERRNKYSSLLKGEGERLSPQSLTIELETFDRILDSENWDSYSQAQPGDATPVTDGAGEPVMSHNGIPLLQIVTPDGKVKHFWQRPVITEYPDGRSISTTLGEQTWIPRAQTEEAKQQTKDRAADERSAGRLVEKYFETSVFPDTPPEEIKQNVAAIIDNAMDIRTQIKKASQKIKQGDETGQYTTIEDETDLRLNEAAQQQQEALDQLNKHVQEQQAREVERKKRLDADRAAFMEARQRQIQQKADNARLEQRLKDAKNSFEQWSIRVGEWENNPRMVNLARNPVIAKTDGDIRNAPMNTIISHKGTLIYKADVDGQPVLFKLPAARPITQAGLVPPA